ncbi:MAG TPA: hypothetical protein VFS43_08525 [Polyangiaceae bacterium]|nr:hypothetical protein [Polyangiaceae bacterium]
MAAGRAAAGELLKAAWRRVVNTAHPDRGGSDAAFVRLKAADDEVCRGLGALSWPRSRPGPEWG